jgi:hypothetical protein
MRVCKRQGEGDSLASFSSHHRHSAGGRAGAAGPPRARPVAWESHRGKSALCREGRRGKKASYCSSSSPGLLPSSGSDLYFFPSLESSIWEKGEACAALQLRQHCAGLLLTVCVRARMIWWSVGRRVWDLVETRERERERERVVDVRAHVWSAAGNSPIGPGTSSARRDLLPPIHPRASSRCFI